jgi:hypothetical protein
MQDSNSIKLTEIIKQVCQSDRSKIFEIINFLENPIICEVGVQLGNHFNDILTENVKEAYAVDSWTSFGKISENDSLFSQQELDQQHQQVCERFSSDTRVKVIRDFSKNASLMFEDDYFDFIYIDADHTYEAVKSDLESWYPKLKKGGIMSGHDYVEVTTSVPFGVVQAVNEFLKKNNISNESFFLTSEQYASYFIIK